MKSRKNIITECIQVILCIVLAAGMFTFLKTCPAKEDGTFMSCHWAGRVITAIGIVILILSIVNLLVKSVKIKIGLTIAIILNQILCALVPGVIVKTCMMNTMRCNSCTKPGVIVLSSIIVIVSIINLVLYIRKED